MYAPVAAALITLAVAPRAAAMSLAPPPSSRAASAGDDPLRDVSSLLAKRRRARRSCHAIFVDDAVNPPDAGHVATIQDLLVATWHGVDHRDLLSENFVFHSPVRIRGSKTLDRQAFAEAPLEVRGALWPDGTPAFYGFATDPFDEGLVSFVCRPNEKSRSLCATEFDAEGRVSLLSIGAPLPVRRGVASTAPPPPAPEPRRGLVGKVRRVLGGAEAPQGN